jgi:hypothetical protein
MRFMFYPVDKSPIEVDAWVRANSQQDWVVRPVPRIGERVVLDSDYYEVTQVVHILQTGSEVRIFVKRVQA